MLENFHSQKPVSLSPADAIIQDRGLKNTFNAEYTTIDGITGLYIPVMFNGKERCGIMRDNSDRRYYKITSGNLRYPLIYNLDNALKDKTFVILTEGVFDCETIQQTLEIPNVISFLSASITQEQLVCLGLFTHVYTLFDNDNAGVNAVKRVSNFLKKYYPDIEMDVIEFIGAKDINEYLLKYGAEKTKQLIINQVDELF